MRRHLAATLALAALVAMPRLAAAENDTFGLGNGQDGGFTASIAEQVVNAYAPLTANAAAGASTLQVGAAVGDNPGFAAQDLVLLWRATGVGAVDAKVGSGNQARASLASLETLFPGSGPIGSWELARVASAAGSTLTLTAPLVANWAKNLTQVIRVPEYTNVTIDPGASIVPLPWTQTGTGTEAAYTGGIVVFLANGTLTMNGSAALDASGRGFRGGAPLLRVNVGANCLALDGTPAAGYAPKGEGIVATEYGPDRGGRGNRSLAAGGGNCSLNGGAGGGNYGQGGAGGNSIPSDVRGGLGGAGVDYSLLSRLTMGGGGGAGEAKNGPGSGGGRGGGAVFVRTRAIAGSGNIRANGESVGEALVSALESDGGGGGGAGGSILLRVVDGIACGTIEANGGKGGNTAIVGVPSWGPGGGGGGGRLLIQSKGITGGCTTSVAAGASGTGPVINGSTAGAAGQLEPLPQPGTNYCFSNPPANPQCAGVTPVCDGALGFCKRCVDPFGLGSGQACPTPGAPVCITTGACSPCDGDLGSTANAACQLAATPLCLAGGACGKCTTNADCTTGTHPGPLCNPELGACGTACTNDTQCKNTEWCATGVCVPKTPNKQPLPPSDPIGGSCTAANGERTCASGVCEEIDDLCGLRNGSLCAGIATRCRSTICFAGDNVCGKPTGETCLEGLECRSHECTGGVCSGCNDDVDCPRERICDRGESQCVFGCRPGAQASNAGNARGACPPEHDCVPLDGGGDIGQCVARTAETTPDGGADAGPSAPQLGFEGAGCGCQAVGIPTASAPFALLVATISAMMLRRPRKRREKEER